MIDFVKTRDDVRTPLLTPVCAVQRCTLPLFAMTLRYADILHFISEGTNGIRLPFPPFCCRCLPGLLMVVIGLFCTTVRCSVFTLPCAMIPSVAVLPATLVLQIDARTVRTWGRDVAGTILPAPTYYPTSIINNFTSSNSQPILLSFITGGSWVAVVPDLSVVYRENSLLC